MNDIEKAKQVAAEQHKDMLINFTGTEWCEYCMRLEREILQKDEFTPVADRFILVRLEYPGGVPRLPQEQPAPHPTWVDTYGVSGYPTLFLADQDGRPYATTGYLPLKPSEYVDHLIELHKVHRQRDEAFAQAKDASGIDQAKALASGLAALTVGFKDTDDSIARDPLLSFYRKEIDAVIDLDKDNAAALRDRYQQVVQRQKDREEKAAFYKQISETYQQKGAAGTIRFLDERLAAPTSGEFRKELCWTRLNYLDGEQAIAYAKQLSADESFAEQDRLRLRRKIATELGRLGRVEESIAIYDELIHEVENDPDRLYHLLSDEADVYREAKRFDEALEKLNVAVKYATPDTVPWSGTQAWRLHMLSRLRRVDEAKSLYESLIKSPVVPAKSQVSLLMVMATRLQEHGSIAAARDAAVKAQETLDRVEDSIDDPKRIEELQTQIAVFLAKTSKASEGRAAAEPSK